MTRGADEGGCGVCGVAFDYAAVAARVTHGLDVGNSVSFLALRTSRAWSEVDISLAGAWS